MYDGVEPVASCASPSLVVLVTVTGRPFLLGIPPLFLFLVSFRRKADKIFSPISVLWVSRFFFFSTLIGFYGIVERYFELFLKISP